jgi:P27 family predicted phage terminase small subunit
MRGTKPKSTAQKRLEGNPGKRALNEREPQPPGLDASFDAPPPELEGRPVALTEWARLVPMLRRCRQITEADRSALIAVCLEWARYLDATSKVTAMVITTQTGYPMPNPYLSIATKALTGCTRLWAELGLTPSSRSRVVVDGPGPAGDAFSEFDAPPPLAARPTEH